MLSLIHIFLSPASGKPIIVPSQDIVLGCYYVTRVKPFARGEGMTFFGVDEVRAAYDQGVIELHAEVKCRVNGKIEKTTVGRVMMYDIVPKVVPFSAVNKVMGKKELAALIDRCYRLCGQKETVLLADHLRTLGYTEGTRAGISIAMVNMEIPGAKKEILERCREQVEDITNQYIEGLITNGERYNKVIDIWSKAAEEISQVMMKNISTVEVTSPDGKEKRSTPSFNPIFIMADSGARGSSQQLKQLAGMRGLMAKPSGDIIETPITANFREGLTVLQYFISTHGARKGLADTALKTANSGYLTRRLVDVAQDAIITEFDCETIDGIDITPLIEGNDIIEGIGDRILGRTALEDAGDPVTGMVIASAGTQIDEDKVKEIEEAGITRVKIRSVLTCQTRRGICAACYGRDLARGQAVNVGEAVGVIAAQSIGEPGTQLTMRTFHVGGIASGSVGPSSYENKGEGTARFENLQTVRRKDGALVAMNRQGELKIIDDSGRERETYPVVYGAVIRVTDGQRVKPGTTLTEWDPTSVPILTLVSGTVKYGDLVENVTMAEHQDETTGISRKVVTDTKDASARPRISIKDKSGNTTPLPDGKGVARYMLPRGAVILVNELDEVSPGDAIAKVIREAAKTKDITGGLPRVAELFEARKPKDVAIISDIDGSVSFGKDTKGKRKVVVTSDTGKQFEYLIPKGKTITVHEGDFVRAGEALMDGAANPHDILRVLGEKALAKYLVDEIQEVYRLQGVKINDKHIEVIVRQMLRRVRITDFGDTAFLVDEQVEKHLLDAENERVRTSGGREAQATALLLGITKASLSTESFISGASFQETTKVLTEAAVSSKIDYLRGLKENVIMGRLIPAGTGLPHYQFLNVQVDEASAYDDTGLLEDIPAELLEVG